MLLTEHSQINQKLQVCNIDNVYWKSSSYWINLIGNVILIVFRVLWYKSPLDKVNWRVNSLPSACACFSRFAERVPSQAKLMATLPVKKTHTH
eukprot:3892657-Amphidinium_carterae.1